MIDSAIIQRVNDDRIDELERVMVENFDEIELPLVHRFTEGMYIREISMPAGSLVTSKIHKTNHPFTISKGKALVSIDNGGWVELSAPYTGITQKGTRRVLYIVEDCIWTTYHLNPEDETDIEKIEHRLIENRENPLLSNNKIIES